MGLLGLEGKYGDDCSNRESTFSCRIYRDQKFLQLWVLELQLPFHDMSAEETLRKTHLKMLNLIKAHKLTMPVGNPAHLTDFVTYLRLDSVTVADSYSFRWDKHSQKCVVHMFLRV